MEMHLKCPVCPKTFLDPVTAACGHSFCKTCQGDAVCPVCKKPVSGVLEVNLVLRDIVQQQQRIQQTNDDLYTGKDDEVPCDVCTENRRKAEKSCLVCLTSYCSTHLENHSSAKRLKGHKLVAPVKNLDDRACLEHGRPLELYNRKKQKCVCVRCLEEDPEDVVSTEEEWNKKKAEIENTKMKLSENINKRQIKMSEIGTSLQSCKDQVDAEWWDIDAVFIALFAIVEEAQAKIFQPLIDRRNSLKTEAADLKNELQADVKRLDRSISELTGISTHEDHILFLQSYPSLPELNGDIRDLADVEFDTSLSFGSMRKTTTIMMEQIQHELEKLTSLELKRVSKFAVDVKPDLATAHVFSDTGKEVKRGGEEYLSGNILGLDSLTSGKCYWEVDVSNRPGWDLGLARRDANNGEVCLNQDKGYRVNVQFDQSSALAAPRVRLSLKEKPEKVGVFVDYEEGLVSFYNLTTQSHMFSFTDCSFSGEIFPYFSSSVKKDKLSV